MATSGRIEDYAQTSSSFRLRADWFRTSVNIQTNTDHIGVNCYVFRTTSLSSSAWTANPNEMLTTLTVNGITKTFRTSFDTRYGKVANVGYFEFDVPHDPDGTKTASISFTFYSNVSSILDGTSTISGSMSLDRIPREALFTQINDFNIGDSAIVSVSNVGNLYASLAIKNGSTTLVSSEGVLNGQIKLDILSSVLYPLTPNSNTLALTAELITYASFGGAQIGNTQTATINARVTNSDPIYDDISVNLENYLNNVVSIVNEYSSATITVIDAIGQNSATISKVSVTCGSVTAESNSPSFDDTWAVTTESIESDAYIVKITDSRGNSVTYSGTFSNVYRGYKKPYVDSVALTRDQLINAETFLNCVLKIDATPRVLGIISSEMNNAPKTVYYSYKETTASTWTSVTIYASDEAYESGKGDIPAPPEMTISGNTVTITDLELSFDTTKQYDFRIGLTDWLNSGYREITLDSASPMLAYKMTTAGNAVGVNMVPTVANGVQSRYGFFDADGGRLCPPGMSFEWNGASIPTGYLSEDGSAISRTTYADLFAVIGTTFGSGNGSTTFNLPNSLGKVVVGLNSGDATFNSLTDTGGVKSVTLSLAQIPQDNIHTAIYANPGGSAIGGLAQYGGDRVSEFILSTNGGGGSHDNLQPYIVKRRIIKY
jgi:microcystin-dependent protein